MSKKFGLDFGTTNSAIAIEKNGIGKVLPIDYASLDSGVVRTMLYFNRREMVFRKNIALSRIKMNLFEAGDYSYEGEFYPLIGQSAVDRYFEENKNRSAGVTRTIFTGRIIDTQSLLEVKGGAGAVREYYEEIDYGVGRLMQALKTALKSPHYKGTAIFGEYFTLEKLISVFVGEIKKVADKSVQDEITDIVVGRPVHFSDDPIKDSAAQKRLEEGLKLAGFKKIEFVYEPVAAAKQFIAQSKKGGEIVLVFDFGGGTLDTALVRGDKVLASDGVYIGGDLLNADIMEHKLWSYFGSKAIFGESRLEMPIHLYEALKSWFSIPNLNNPNTMALLERVSYKNSDVEAVNRLRYFIKMNLGFDLYEAIERAKIKLSQSSQANIVFKDGPIDINIPITREEFENIINPRVDETRKVVLRTLKTAKLEPDQVDIVVRTGGSSLIPVFEDMLVDIFGAKKIQQFETFTSIASGLAL